MKELKKLFTVSRLSQIVSAKKTSGIQVFLYGSAARGEDDEHSDFDLLVIGREDCRGKFSLPELAGKAKIAFFTPLEYSVLRKKDAPFYDSIERNKIRLV